MWTEEQIFFDGDAFFADLSARIGSATHSIDLESYIFDTGPFGERIVAELCAAARRGVAVRVMVDGIGSPGWAAKFADQLREAGGDFRVFHRLPWDSPGHFHLGARSSRLLDLLRTANRRNHRKLIIIDAHDAFVGSMNISHVHLASLVGKSAWRDTGIRVVGSETVHLLNAFQYTWNRKHGLRRFRKRLTVPPEAPVRINTTRKLRKRNYRDLIRRLRSAQRRIWITTPYFVPNGQLLRALTDAASRGVEVKILVPSLSDVFFMPWVASAFRQGLARAGALMYGYLPTVLHAKTVIIDDWMTIGSSNMNHRSIHHDLEVDVVVGGTDSCERLARSFLIDLESSQELLGDSLVPWNAWIGRLLLLFRNWL